MTRKMQVSTSLYTLRLQPQATYYTGQLSSNQVRRFTFSTISIASKITGKHRQETFPGLAIRRSKSRDMVRLLYNYEDPEERTFQYGYIMWHTAKILPPIWCQCNRSGKWDITGINVQHTTVYEEMTAALWARFSIVTVNLFLNIGPRENEELF